MTKNITMKNYEVEPLKQFLAEIPLKGASSRMRTRFINILNDQINLISEERNVLVEDYAKKDDEGNSVTETTEDGRLFVIIEDKEQYNKEILKLMHEDFIYGVSPEKEQMISSVYDALINYDRELTGEEAFIYDRFCEIFEVLDV